MTKEWVAPLFRRSYHSSHHKKYIIDAFSMQQRKKSTAFPTPYSE